MMMNKYKDCGGGTLIPSGKIQHGFAKAVFASNQDHAVDVHEMVGKDE